MKVTISPSRFSPHFFPCLTEKGSSSWKVRARTFSSLPIASVSFSCSSAKAPEFFLFPPSERMSSFAKEFRRLFPSSFPSRLGGFYLPPRSNSVLFPPASQSPLFFFSHVLKSIPFNRNKISFMFTSFLIGKWSNPLFSFFKRNPSPLEVDFFLFLVPAMVGRRSLPSFFFFSPLVP